VVILKVTHSDVPGAFTVGFVGRRESFTGHDAGVCDQVASAVEDGPEKGESHNRHQLHSTPGENTALLRVLRQRAHTHYYICAENHSGTVCLYALTPGRFPMNSPDLCFFFLLLKKLVKPSQKDEKH